MPKGGGKGKGGRRGGNYVRDSSGKFARTPGGAKVEIIRKGKVFKDKASPEYHKHHSSFHAQQATYQSKKIKDATTAVDKKMAEVKLAHHYKKAMFHRNTAKTLNLDEATLKHTSDAFESVKKSVSESAMKKPKVKDTTGTPKQKVDKFDQLKLKHANATPGSFEAKALEIKLAHQTKKKIKDIDKKLEKLQEKFDKLDKDTSDPSASKKMDKIDSEITKLTAEKNTYKESLKTESSMIGKTAVVGQFQKKIKEDKGDHVELEDGAKLHKSSKEYAGAEAYHKAKAEGKSDDEAKKAGLAAHKDKKSNVTIDNEILAATKAANRAAMQSVSAKFTDAPVGVYAGKAHDIDFMGSSKLKSTTNEQFNQLSASEKKSVVYYTGGSYSQINGALRKMSGYSMSSVQSHTDQIDKAMRKAVVKEDTVVVRGAGGSLMIQKFSNMKPGDEWTEPGYSSTSAVHGSNFTKPLMMKINVPKGMRALSIDGKSQHPSEDEVLLPRGTRYRVDGFEKKKQYGDDVLIMHVTVVGHHDAPGEYVNNIF